MRVTKAQLCEIVCRDERTISRWQNNGMPVLEVGLGRGNENEYDTGAVIEWLVQLAQQRGEKETARDRLDRIKADREELALVTQQNAALVEQASAAAQSLVDQAESLRAAVAVFKIAGQAANEATSTSAAPAPKAGRLVAPVSAPRSLPGKAKLASASAVNEWETF